MFRSTLDCSPIPYMSLSILSLTNFSFWRQSYTRNFVLWNTNLVYTLLSLGLNCCVVINELKVIPVKISTNLSFFRLNLSYRIISDTRRCVWAKREHSYARQSVCSAKKFANWFCFDDRKKLIIYHTNKRWQKRNRYAMLFIVFTLSHCNLLSTTT